MTVLLTGAAGHIGSVLAPALAREGLDVRLTDVTPIDDVPAGCTAHTADLRDYGQVRAVMEGASAVVHLGAIPSEAPFEDIVDSNIRASHNVLEAARQGGVGRVVLASSLHATGFYAGSERVRPADPVRPDTFYGVSKVMLEALGYLYARKCGIEVVCLRIGSFEAEASEPRHRATWLSYGDAVRLVLAALRGPLPAERFLVTYGLSALPDEWMSRDGWDIIGYEPQDVPYGLAAPDPDDWHGSPFTDEVLPAARAAD